MAKIEKSRIFRETFDEMYSFFDKFEIFGGKILGAQ